MRERTAVLPRLWVMLSALCLTATCGLVGVLDVRTANTDHAEQVAARAHGQVTLAGGRLMVALVNAEAAERAYLLTREPLYLGPYRSSVAAVRAQLGRLTTADGLEGAGRRVVGLVEWRIRPMWSAIAAEQHGRHRQAVRADESRRSYQVMIRIRDALGDVRTAAAAALARATTQHQLAHRNLQAGAAGVGLELVAALVVLLSSRAHRGRLSSLVANSRLRRIFDSAPIGMAVVALDDPRPGVFLEANDAMLTMTGYSSAQLQDLDIVSLAHPDDHREIAAELLKARSDGIPAGTADRGWLCADGRTIRVQVSATVVAGGRARRRCLVVQAVDVTDQKQAHEELRRESLHDPLTGLANRKLYWELAAQAMTRARRHGTRVGVLYLDIDDFKLVNDRYGHTVGDYVLQLTARRLTSALRASDTATRLGGDEFAVLCEDLTGMADLQALRGRLADVLGEPIDVPGVGSLRVGVSIGSTLGGTPSVTVEELTRDADAAMYAEKRRLKAAASGRTDAARA